MPLAVPYGGVGRPFQARGVPHYTAPAPVYESAPVVETVPQPSCWIIIEGAEVTQICQ